MKTPLRGMLGQPSWRLAASEVEGYVTEVGGHLGPVVFDAGRRRLQPFAVAPWAEEGLGAEHPPILRVLRGDFFCLPFGSNTKPHDRERHVLHGETANEKWTLESLTMGGGRSQMHLSMRTKVRRGRVDKVITFVDGESVVYSRHLVSGMDGPMPLGHHAMLKFPDRPGCGWVSTSPFVYGQVFPEVTERPEARGYSWLKPGAEFAALERVRTVSGEEADLSRYPARRGFEDIAMLVSDVDVPFAWTAVTFPRERYAWFALKDPRVLRSTLLWFSNGGRHYPPWDGRHVNVLGLEEVTAYFHYGLAESVAMNPISERGYATSVLLHPDRPLAVNVIVGLALLPAGFDRVVAIEVDAAAEEGVVLRSASGKAVHVPLQLDFLSGREI